MPSLHGKGKDHDKPPAGPGAMPCAVPVAKGPVNFPDSVGGRAHVNYPMYSGYVNVTSTDYLFYWYFGNAKNDPNAPLIIWTNGGPGCTAMEGATTEIGPLVLTWVKEACSTAPNCDYTYQLSLNPYAWNNDANVVFLDQPRNVGFSFGTTSCHSSVDAGKDMVTFYLGWLALFPEFKGRAVYLAGESYGGHYIPAWANAVLDYNANPGSMGPINLAGLAIGNGCVNNTVQDTNSIYIEFLKSANLIPASSNVKTQSAAYTEMVNYIGYEPNYYDYSLRNVRCPACYSYNYTAWSYWFLQPTIDTVLNVCGDAGVDAFAGSAGGCINMGAFDVGDTFSYSGALARVLNLNIPVMLYYGKVDTACNYVGGLAMANTIPWVAQSKFASANMTTVYLGGAPAGQIKNYGALSFFQVEAAGHMVPIDAPAASAYAISKLLGKI